MVEFASKYESYDLFIKGKVDLVVGSETVIPYWLQKTGNSHRKVEPVLALHGIGGNHLAINLKMPADIAETMQQALNQLRLSGEYEKIIEQFYAHSVSRNEK